ncbi:MAG: peptidylprolyl isomerase [Lacinutrix sp.]|uniref:peptidylprolyl isomerase n=1 Tax=Lacinutrix sp. TaxID=1937692 RepID=UPI00309DCA24
MKIKYLLSFFALVFTTLSLVQAQDKEVLFTIDTEPVYASEFLRVYNKNLDLVKDESQKDVDGYLKLFINYKLKLQEAKRLKLDEKPKYIREFENYKRQLTKNYLSDNEVTDALVVETYNRLQTEINASHVLVRIDESASPKDTLAAYNEIIKLRDRVIAEGYKKVQSDVHNGKTIFAEDLGYFSAFGMVYPFETAAYNTKVGEVSQPFRTRFGYHVVTVFNKRKSRGELIVAHILVKTKKVGDTVSETKINEIYKRLQQGEAFEALAKQLSEDQGTASKGGKLKPFKGGELSSTEFEEEAYKLKNTKEISKPFKTQFGWHIIKLLDSKAIASFEEMKPKLESRIKRDSRSKVINDSRVKALKEKYIIEENKEVLSYFKTIVTEDYFNNRCTLPANFDGDKTAFKIQDKIISYNDFGQFLIKNQRNYNNKASTISIIVDINYNNLLEKELLAYQENNLINANSDYAQIVEEYRDGLLLFDLMESEIWNVAKSDSVALEKYFNAYQNKYYFPERVDAIVASSANKNIVKKIRKLLDKGLDVEAIKNLVNTNGQVNVSFTANQMDKTHQALPSNFKFKKGVSKVFNHNDAYVVIQVKEILPQTQKTFLEAKGNVTSDYQVFKEENWLKELSTIFAVKVNQDVLAKVKKTIQN